MTLLSLTPSNIFMILGFILSLYTCVSNDVIQTLGTFLSSTKERPVWQVWLFTSTVLIITFVAGWLINDGDMAFGLLDRIPHPETFYWWHILPPLILLYLTKKGIPVATSFLIISIFSSNTIIGMMVAKSFMGYIAALVVSLVLYFFIARSVEKIFLYMKNKPVAKGWVITKWISTAILWTAWLLQDGSKIFVYLPSVGVFKTKLKRPSFIRFWSLSTINFSIILDGTPFFSRNLCVPQVAIMKNPCE